MSIFELNNFAERAKRMLAETTISWGITLEDTLKFTIEDLYYLNKNFGLNITMDDRGCLSVENIV